ncbi:Hypothetical predicted protein [Cloeon dipterum]|uniref:Uncharacterized protein n=1 Tax=Cloeon dipterum TaxID=197152 RepID=A0A8S1DG97_9INSE|nr:Hypothetical predicted protein [Cloeon dipterum]
MMASEIEEGGKITIGETSSESSGLGQQPTRESTLLRTQRRRNRKKLVATKQQAEEAVTGNCESKVQEQEETQPSVTFRELPEVRPICEGKIYVQREHSFVPVNQNSFFEKSASATLPNEVAAFSPETVASELQRRCLPVATFCHGLLAGLALWHAITVDASPCDKSVSVVNIERTFQIIFYILSTVSAVSVLDWCVPSNVSSFRAFQRHLAENPASVFALAACIAAHLASDLSAKLDDQHAFKLSNSTSLIATNENFEEMHKQWQTLNLVRCVLAVLGFFLTAISRNSH